MKSDINPFYPLSSKTKSKEIANDIRQFLENTCLNVDDEVYKRLKEKLKEICQVTVFIEPEWGNDTLSKEYVSTFYISIYSHYILTDTVMTPVKKENFAKDLIKKFPDMEYFCFQGRWYRRNELSKVEWIYF